MKVQLLSLVLSLLISFALAKIGSRITGGYEVKPNSIPYQAALFVNSNAQTYFCSGALVTKTTVLSVARCASLSNSIEIVLGAHHVFQVEDTQLRINASEVIIHPDFDTTTIQNDLAVLRFDEIELNDKIQPATLPTRFDFLIMDPVKITGWGSHGDYEDLSDALFIVTDLYTPYEEGICQKFYVTPINETIQFCTDDVWSNGVCDGDSGDPVLDDFDLLVGLVSYINPSGCLASYPAVHTMLYPYLDWIANNSDVVIEDGPKLRIR